MATCQASSLHRLSRMLGMAAGQGQDEAVYAAQVRLLYHNAYIGLLVNVVVATAAVFVMWQHVPPWLLWGWLLILLLVTAIRAVMTRNCLRLPEEACDPMLWGRRYLYGTFAAGLLWGSVGLILELYGSHTEHSFAAYILGGMAAGAIATNGALPIAYLSFVLPVLLPVSLAMLLQDDHSHQVTGVLTSFLIVVLIITFNRHYRVVRNSIELRFEKEEALNALRSAHQLLDDMTANLAEGLLILDSNGMATFMNPEAEQLLGWRLEELQGRKTHDLIHLDENGDSIPEQDCEILRTLRERTVSQREDVLFRRKDGKTIPVAYIASPMTLPGGEPAVAVSFQDISVRKAMEQQLAQFATHDSLTGLYNRRELERQLEEETIRAARYRRPLSLYLIDVDHFKQVNDNYGHDVGDEILRQLSDRIREAIRGADIATRYGGEEFLVILPETSEAEAVAAAERLREAIAASPFPLSEDRALDIRVSIGVAHSPGEGADAQRLIKAADTALYRAKETGRNRVCVA